MTQASSIERATRTLTALVVAVVVTFWLLAGLAEMATLYFDPEIPMRVTWHAWCKRGGLALYWIAVTFLALIWYRSHPVDASTLKRHLATTVLASIVLTALYIAYFGLLIDLIYGAEASWAVEDALKLTHLGP
mgnify:CR=1 FL=1